MATVAGDAPENVVVMRENFHWMTSAIMLQVVAKIRAALREACLEKQMVLMLDTVQNHLTLELVKHAAQHPWDYGFLLHLLGARGFCSRWTSASSALASNGYGQSTRR